MSDESKTFDQQIHDAYESIELDANAQERMLANLLAAQAERAQEPSDESATPEPPSTTREATTPAAATTRAAEPDAVPSLRAVGPGQDASRKAEPAASPRRRNVWKIALPLAAVLLVAVVVIRLQVPVANEAATAAFPSADKSGGTATDEAYMETEESAAAVDAEATGASPEASAEATEGNNVTSGGNTKTDAGATTNAGATEGQSTVKPDATETFALTGASDTTDGDAATELDYAAESDAGTASEEAKGSTETPSSSTTPATNYPTITLSDGTKLSTTPVGASPVEVDESRLGASLGSATATSSDGSGQQTCEVYAIAEGDGYAVRYSGDKGYWYATAIS